MDSSLKSITKCDTFSRGIRAQKLLKNVILLSRKIRTRKVLKIVMLFFGGGKNLDRVISEVGFNHNTCWVRILRGNNRTIL